MNFSPEDDPDRFAEWFMRSQRDLYGYILAVVPDLHAADEIFQETGLALWKKHTALESREHFLRFAFGVARNCIRAYLSKKGRDRHIFSDAFIERLADARSEQSGWLDEQIVALSQCLARLSEKQRRLIQAFYGSRRTTSQLAGELGVSENALYQKLHRIRRILLDCVTKVLRKEAG